MDHVVAKPKKRRDSILKARATTNLAYEETEVNEQAKTVNKRRVSIHNVVTVQNYAKNDESLLDGSPQRQKINETLGSDGVFTPGRTANSSHGSNNTMEMLTGKELSHCQDENQSVDMSIADVTLQAFQQTAMNITRDMFGSAMGNVTMGEAEKTINIFGNAGNYGQQVNKTNCIEMDMSLQSSANNTMVDKDDTINIFGNMVKPTNSSSTITLSSDDVRSGGEAPVEDSLLLNETNENTMMMFGTKANTQMGQQNEPKVVYGSQNVDEGEATKMLFSTSVNMNMSTPPRDQTKVVYGSQNIEEPESTKMIFGGSGGLGNTSVNMSLADPSFNGTLDMFPASDKVIQNTQKSSSDTSLANDGTFVVQQPHVEVQEKGVDESILNSGDFSYMEMSMLPTTTRTTSAEKLSGEDDVMEVTTDGTNSDRTFDILPKVAKITTVTVSEQIINDSIQVPMARNTSSASNTLQRINDSVQVPVRSNSILTDDIFLSESSPRENKKNRFNSVMDTSKPSGSSRRDNSSSSRSFTNDKNKSATFIDNTADDVDMEMTVPESNTFTQASSSAGGSVDDGTVDGGTFSVAMNQSLSALQDMSFTRDTQATRSKQRNVSDIFNASNRPERSPMQSPRAVAKKKIKNDVETPRRAMAAANISAVAMNDQISYLEDPGAKERAMTSSVPFRMDLGDVPSYIEKSSEHEPDVVSQEKSSMTFNNSLQRTLRTTLVQEADKAMTDNDIHSTSTRTVNLDESQGPRDVSHVQGPSRTAMLVTALKNREGLNSSDSLTSYLEKTRFSAIATQITYMQPTDGDTDTVLAMRQEASDKLAAVNKQREVEAIAYFEANIGNLRQQDPLLAEAAENLNGRKLNSYDRDIMKASIQLAEVQLFNDRQQVATECLARIQQEEQPLVTQLEELRQKQQIIDSQQDLIRELAQLQQEMESYGQLTPELIATLNDDFETAKKSNQQLQDATFEMQMLKIDLMTKHQEERCKQLKMDTQFIQQQHKLEYEKMKRYRLLVDQIRHKYANLEDDESITMDKST